MFTVSKPRFAKRPAWTVTAVRPRDRTGGLGLALDPKPATPPALLEAGSAVCGVIQSPEEGERGVSQITASL
jgi:hypothetical protein